MNTPQPTNIPAETLASLTVGQSATVTGIDAPRPLKRRLMDMGLTKGVLVKVLKVAPMGDPVEIKLRGYHLCLRHSEASTISVVRS